MAQIIGESSKYLLKKQRYHIILAGCALLAAIILCFSLSRINFTKLPLVVTLLILLIFIVIYRKSLWLFSFHDKMSDNYYNGRIGEEDILDTLRDLTDDFFVIRGIKFEKIGDVDFTVVGPTGIFTIDAKDFRKYQITFDGQELNYNGRRQPKDILKQAKREAVEINNIILEKNVNIFVEPVLVFSSYVKLNFGLNKQNGVYVIGRPYLIKLITTKGVTYLEREKVTAIVDAIKEKLLNKNQK